MVTDINPKVVGCKTLELQYIDVFAVFVCLSGRTIRSYSFQLQRTIRQGQSPLVRVPWSGSHSFCSIGDKQNKKVEPVEPPCCSSSSRVSGVFVMFHFLCASLPVWFHQLSVLNMTQHPARRRGRVWGHDAPSISLPPDKRMR